MQPKARSFIFKKQKTKMLEYSFFIIRNRGSFRNSEVGYESTAHYRLQILNALTFQQKHKYEIQRVNILLDKHHKFKIPLIIHARHLN